MRSLIRRGNPRLADPADWVRREIEIAINRRMLLVPIVLDRAEMPSTAVLPKHITLLARTQAFFIDGRSDEIFQASIKIVAEHILNTIQAQVKLARKPAGWWSRIEINRWTLYIDAQPLLSLNYSETSASAAVATGPHTLRVEWSEKEEDSRFGRVYAPGRSSAGITEDQKVVLQPGKYRISLVPDLDTRGFLRKIGDFFGSTDSLPRQLHVTYRPAPKANSRVGRPDPVSGRDRESET